MKFNIKEDREKTGQDTMKVILTLDDNAPNQLAFSNGGRTIEKSFGPLDKDELKAARKVWRDEEVELIKAQVKDLGLGEKVTALTTTLVKTISVDE